MERADSKKDWKRTEWQIKSSVWKYWGTQLVTRLVTLRWNITKVKYQGHIGFDD